MLYAAIANRLLVSMTGDKIHRTPLGLGAVVLAGVAGGMMMCSIDQAPVEAS